MISAKEAKKHLDADGTVKEKFINEVIDPMIREVYEKETHIELELVRWGRKFVEDDGWVIYQLDALGMWKRYNANVAWVTKKIKQELEDNGYKVTIEKTESSVLGQKGKMIISWL